MLGIAEYRGILCWLLYESSKKCLHSDILFSLQIFYKESSKRMEEAIFHCNDIALGLIFEKFGTRPMITDAIRQLVSVQNHKKRKHYIYLLILKSTQLFVWK